jgi:hypothetical protein
MSSWNWTLVARLAAAVVTAGCQGPPEVSDLSVIRAAETVVAVASVPVFDTRGNRCPDPAMNFDGCVQYATCNADHTGCVPVKIVCPFCASPPPTTMPPMPPMPSPKPTQPPDLEAHRPPLPDDNARNDYCHYPRVPIEVMGVLMPIGVSRRLDLPLGCEGDLWPDTFPGGAVQQAGFSSWIWPRLTPSEKDFAKAHPDVAADFFLDSIKARIITNQRWHGAAYRNDNGPENAFQHAMWNALMAWDWGSDFATSEGDRHERWEMNPADERQMDTHNNGVGVRIGQGWTGTLQQLSDEVFRQCITNAMCTWICGPGGTDPTPMGGRCADAPPEMPDPTIDMPPFI